MENKKLRKSIKLYLSKKLKKVPRINLKSSIGLRSACKYPKTPSFDRRDPASNHHTINHSATLSDIDHFVSENFQSLCINEDSNSLTNILTKARAKMHVGLSGNLASTSSRISSPTTAYTSETEAGVGIITFSVDPYEDFRSSMKKLVEAHHADANQPIDWVFMEELMLCYLEYNDQSMHKHVLRAFSYIITGFCPSRVSGMSRRTVPVSMGRQKAVERVASAGCYSPADFPVDYDN